VERAFYLLDKLGDVVEQKAGLEIAQIAGHHLERRTPGCRALACEPATQGFVDDLAERPSGTARFGLELRCHVFVKSERSSHVMKPWIRLHDGNFGYKEVGKTPLGEPTVPFLRIIRCSRYANSVSGSASGIRLGPCAKHEKNLCHRGSVSCGQPGYSRDSCQMDLSAPGLPDQPHVDAAASQADAAGDVPDADLNNRTRRAELAPTGSVSPKGNAN
jgi:hypothetical protein